jgi:hypothetical protein
MAAGELGSEWDPMQGGFGETMDGGQNGMIPGLLFLSSFAGISIGAFMGAGGLAIGLPPSYYAGTTINGVVYFGLTPEAAAAVAAVGTGAVTQDAATALVGSALMGGGTALGVDAAAIIAIDHYNIAGDGQHYQNFGDYFSLFIPGYTGPGTSPGYPNFPGGGYPNPFGTGGLVCWVPFDVEYCHWEE